MKIWKEFYLVEDHAHDRRCSGAWFAALFLGDYPHSKKVAQSMVLSGKLVCVSIADFFVLNRGNPAEPG